MVRTLTVSAFLLATMIGVAGCVQQTPAPKPAPAQNKPGVAVPIPEQGKSPVEAAPTD